MNKANSHSVMSGLYKADDYQVIPASGFSQKNSTFLTSHHQFLYSEYELSHSNQVQDKDTS
ncbi:hypothetical protein KY285_035424 [Solanum tuberosum]|nr:hypothetical protein KY284_035537 [Solanum tuberosum]KAH0635769.1 hypothetical protein KY289_035684 [Solanum tuberosum]KAH0638838.1 hypothetical protein KY285_035424 [Solanum tuberosum]